MATSLASATGTRIEEGSRINQQCRVNSRFLESIDKDGDASKIKRHAKNYTMERDECVVLVNQPLNSQAISMSNKRHAYPSVVTTLGDVDEYFGAVMTIMYGSGKRIDDDFFDKINKMIDQSGLKGDELNSVKTRVSQMRDFKPVGISVGLAQPEETLGDTVATVQVGGLRTILNGPFPIRTGDMVMVYCDDIEGWCFDDSGDRVQGIKKLLQDAISNPNEFKVTVEYVKRCMEDKRTIVPGVNDKVKPWDAANNKFPDDAVTERGKTWRRSFHEKRVKGFDRSKKTMFTIKPWAPSRLMAASDDDVYADRFRVIGRAMSNADPYEPIDILLSRQGL